MSLKFNRLGLVFVLTFLTMMGGMSLALSKQENPHGGSIKEADGYYIEVKSAGKNLNIYLLNNKKEPIGTKNITGKVLFFFRDSTDIDINLKAINENAFTCFAPPGYYACKVTFNILGKSVSANFPTQSPVVMRQ
jgi:hypothetical protein